MSTPRSYGLLTASRWNALLLLPVCWLWFAAQSAGQTSTTGALTVTAKDASGAVIPGATVTVSNTAGVTRTQKTNAAGSYTFPLLPPGDYKVTISATGFKTVDVPSVAVHVTETEALNQTLGWAARRP